jgi:signal transduction histidine kinase
VINLLDNACQAIVGTEAPETFPHTITIRSRQDGNRVEIRISDTGPGIPEEAFAQIFEPLYSTKSFGVGLGLPIVRQIIEQHGGGIELKNNPEHGATALFWLPLSSGDTFKELV